jgi:hypothetical protein
MPRISTFAPTLLPLLGMAGITMLLAGCGSVATSPAEPTTDGQPLASAARSAEPRLIPKNALRLPASIDATGASDVSAPLQKFIDDTPNGSTIVFKAGGTYRLGKVVVVSNKKGLTFEGNGATLKLTSGGDYNGSAIHVQNGSTDTTIRDLSIVGNHAAAGTKDTCCSREHQHGIGVYSATDTLIEQVDISRVGGDCVNIKDFNAPNGKVWSDGVTIRGMTCRLTGRMGVVIHSARDVLIEDNVFDEIGYSVFGFEPNYSYQGSTGVTIRNNTIGSYGLTNRYRGFLLYAWDAPWINGPSTIRDVTLTGNTVAGNRGGKLGKMLGLDVWVSGDAGNKFNFTVTNNTAAQPVAGPVIRFTKVKGVTVTGNKQPLSSGTLVSIR